jgi:hypothetical protein
MGRRLTARCVLHFLVCFLLGAPLAAAESDQAWIRGVFTGHSPRPVRAADADVATIAAEGGDVVVVGRGRSMQPLYPAGTRLVLRRTPFAALRSGQTVVYRNRTGWPVAHVLVAHTRDGWRARGLNNRHHDFEPVREENLLGVVVAAFAGPAMSAREVFFLSDD